MSVIGKMIVASTSDFDTGQKVALTVVCENQLMANYHPENENVVFTRYSPSGDGTIHLDTPQDFPRIPKTYGDQTHDAPCELYLVYLQQAEQPNTDGAIFHAALRVASTTDYGGGSRTIELRNRWASEGRGYSAQEREARLVTLRLGIDNPRASNQMKPQAEDWWLLAFRADQMSMEDALALAHRGS